MHILEHRFILFHILFHCTKSKITFHLRLLLAAQLKIYILYFMGLYCCFLLSAFKLPYIRLLSFDILICIVLALNIYAKKHSVPGAVIHMVSFFSWTEMQNIFCKNKHTNPSHIHTFNTHFYSH